MIARPDNWPKWIRDPLPVDWPEDAAADPDNGCYMNNCCHCRVRFFGNKRRPVCKLCHLAKPSCTPECGETACPERPI